MLHHPRPICELTGGHSGPASRGPPRIRDVESPSQQAGVEQGRGFNRGDLRTGAWASGHVVCAKSSATRARSREILALLLGFLHASPSWAFPRFATGCGPSRRPCWIPLSTSTCAFNVHMADLHRVQLTPSHRSHAARSLLRLSLQHLVKRRTRALGDALIVPTQSSLVRPATEREISVCSVLKVSLLPRWIVIECFGVYAEKRHPSATPRQEATPRR